MSTVQVLIAAIGLLRELIKYLREKQPDKKKRPEAVKALKDGFKKSRMNGSTRDLEDAFKKYL